jgi:hypothetical protein
MGEGVMAKVRKRTWTELAPLASDFINGVPPSPPPGFSPADRRLIQEAMEIIPFYTAAERRFGEFMAKLIPLYLDEPEIIGFGEPDERP